MLLGRKVKLNTTKEQFDKLFMLAGISRFSYNWSLGYQYEQLKKNGKILKDKDLRKIFTKIRQSDEYPWLRDVSNDIPKQAIKDSYKAFSIWLFEKRNSSPRFKKKHKVKPSFYCDTFKTKILDNEIYISKFGNIKISEPINKDIKIYNPRVSFDGKAWYFSFNYDKEEIVNNLSNEIIGIDLGIEKLLTCSNGMVFDNINNSNLIMRIEKRLKKLQRKLSKKYLKNKDKDGKYKKTNNIIKLERKIKLIHRRLTLIRNNYIGNITNKIVKTKPSKIVMEDLSVKEMKTNKKIAKHLQKAKFYEIRKVLEYKSKLNGIEFELAYRYYPSSKICSNCNHIHSMLKLSDRTFNCPKCNNTINRDLNASINLKNYSLDFCQSLGVEVKEIEKSNNRKKKKRKKNS